MSTFTPIASRKQRKRYKKGVSHEMTKYHIELCCSLLSPKAYEYYGWKSVRKKPFSVGSDF